MGEPIDVGRAVAPLAAGAMPFGTGDALHTSTAVSTFQKPEKAVHRVRAGRSAL
jgi:hypothetical protein